MKHVYDPKEYPYANRKDAVIYEFSPTYVDNLGNDLKGNDIAEQVTAVAHNVREAYPSLALSTIRIVLPLTLEITVEGNRLSPADALVTARGYARGRRPINSEVRAYSALLREEIGQVIRDVDLFITPDSGLRTPTAAELVAPEGWDS